MQPHKVFCFNVKWIPHPLHPSPLNLLPHLWNWSSSLWSEPSYLFYVLYYTSIDLPTVALDFVSKSIKGSRTLISYFKRIFPGSYVFGVSLLQVTQTLMHIGKNSSFFKSYSISVSLQIWEAMPWKIWYLKLGFLEVQYLIRWK